jgi:hypothetical protein
VNGGRSTTTDGSGNYSLVGLQQAGFTVNVSTNGCVSVSRGVTLTSNQTLSFQLWRSTLLVQVGVWLLEAHPHAGDTGSVTAISIDGVNLALVSTLTADREVLTTIGTTQLARGTHVTSVTLSRTDFPVVAFGGSVSSAVQVQGAALTLGGPCPLAACVWAGYVPSLFSGTLGLAFTVP